MRALKRQTILLKGKHKNNMLKFIRRKAGKGDYKISQEKRRKVKDDENDGMKWQDKEIKR